MVVDSKALVANLRQIAENAGLSAWAQQVLGIAAACILQADEDQKENDRLRDTNRSYGETIVQLNEAAQRSELKAMRLNDLVHRLSDCILGAHLEGLDGPFHAADGLDACPNITDNDGMEVLNGDVAEALTVLAQAQAILREARETTGKEEP